ncbi:chorismate mutase [candidate division KSB1 bacterium]|nr:chorismate mutase [candidate division KSB1 bacterium]
MTLETCRQNIDKLDLQILELLNERAQWVEKIGELKQLQNRPILDENREQHIMQELYDHNKGPLTDEAIANIFRIIIQEGRRLQAAPRTN